MKYKTRDIKVFSSTLDKLDTSKIVSLGQSMHEEVYIYEEFKKIGSNNIDRPSNIFQEYNTETYRVYKEISKLLSEACRYYSIDKDRQNYFIKGKVFEYTEKNNNEVFDFPGKDIPIFHGFVVLGPESINQTYSTDKHTSSYIFNKGSVTLSSPTNFINTKVKSQGIVIEYYLSPVSSIIQNHQSLWIPIL